MSSSTGQEAQVMQQVGGDLHFAILLGVLTHAMIIDVLQIQHEMTVAFLQEFYQVGTSSPVFLWLCENIQALAACL